MLLEELRRHRILMPAQRTLELLVHQARSRAERMLYRALANGLTDAQGDTLDTLLNQMPEAATIRNVISNCACMEVIVSFKHACDSD
jgi:hypothetical protein